MITGQKKDWLKFLYILMGFQLLELILANATGNEDDIFFSIVKVFLVGLWILKVKFSKEDDVDIPIQNSKIILAEVILVDNYHNPKKLICQGKNEQGIIVQYEKMQKMTFSEKPGDTVKVKVDIENENIYEVMSGV